MLSRLRLPFLQRALPRRAATTTTTTMSPKTPDDLANLSILYKTGRLAKTSTSATPSKSLNDRITLHRGDITQLEVGAIVNAANNSLLGGGGVDGAIHRAAGPGLLRECKTLAGCATGSAKITSAYDLPCKKVIHAVGPIYDEFDPEPSETKLRGCYRTALELAVQSGLSSIAFSAISTGIYGYPSREAAPVAITTVKDFLEGKDGDKIKLVVFVVFEKKDLDAYTDILPQYFPPVPEGGDAAAEPTSSGEKTESKEVDAAKEAQEAQEEAEARTVASELPDVPKSDPDDVEHADKKAKHEE